PRRRGGRLLRAHRLRCSPDEKSVREGKSIGPAGEAPRRSAFRFRRRRAGCEFPRVVGRSRGILERGRGRSDEKGGYRRSVVAGRVLLSQGDAATADRRV